MTTNDDLNATVAHQLKIPKLQSFSKQVKWQMTYSRDGWLSVQVHVAEGENISNFPGHIFTQSSHANEDQVPPDQSLCIYYTVFTEVVQ